MYSTHVCVVCVCVLCVDHTPGQTGGDHAVGSRVASPSSRHSRQNHLSCVHTVSQTDATLGDHGGIPVPYKVLWTSCDIFFSTKMSHVTPSVTTYFLSGFATVDLRQ